jgi:hypothetical protein
MEDFTLDAEFLLIKATLKHNVKIITVTIHVRYVATNIFSLVCACILETHKMSNCIIKIVVRKKTLKQSFARNILVKLR